MDRSDRSLIGKGVGLGFDDYDRSLIGKGVGLGFDDYCSGELLDKYYEHYEQHLASLGNK